MEKGVILKYKTAADLKKKIIEQYVQIIKGEKKMHEEILADKNWASDGGEYHTNCRLQMTKRCIEADRQIKLLTTKQ